MGSNTSYVADLLISIAERGRTLLDRSQRVSGAMRVETLAERCETLLSGKGEASGAALAADILHRYALMNIEEATVFFDVLAEKFGPDSQRLANAIDAYGKQGASALGDLHRASEPRRQELFRRFNLAPGGTLSLVRMREQLMDAMARRPDFVEVDRDFAHLFSSWFNRGFLVLKRIDWSTPANVLEKIIRYEAVHAIRDWDDLRSRIDSPDRRCYAFFHPALVDEPLIFVEVALMKETPAAIFPILDPARKPLRVQEATTAVFYSISNCQKGLAGVSFGNFLIKQVLEEISRELPSLTTFVTLSPVPGFQKWLDVERKAEQSMVLSQTDRKALAALDTPDWMEQPALRDELTTVLAPIAAYYFLAARTSKGAPLDPVARFHLGNGARLERINPLGDLSAKGVVQAAGLMVNYRYMPADIEKNHEAFAGKGEIVASAQVRRLLKVDPTSRALVPTT